MKDKDHDFGENQYLTAGASWQGKKDRRKRVVIDQKKTVPRGAQF